MNNVAIIVGNSEYDQQSSLNCCINDVKAIREIIEASARYTYVQTILNENADQMKNQIRESLSFSSEIEEIFFYFSGHGSQGKSDFFYCPTNFDTNRPNETGLSVSELHDLFRAANPKLVVKVVDACNSGTALIKSEGGFLGSRKGELSNLIQIASCLNSQESLTGDPLSEFTERFCRAVLRKEEGPVFYTDITNTIRDDFLNDDEQTPHFVSQGTGREVFVEDAARLKACRDHFQMHWFRSLDQGQVHEENEQNSTPSTLELIEKAEAGFVGPDAASQTIEDFFDLMKSRIASQDFSRFFDVNIVEHSYYNENTTKEFIIRSLMNEKRPDNFVTASIYPKKI